MCEIEEKFKGAILADDMGLGKTIHAIALLLRRPVWATLIVVPASMVTDWESALARWAPKMPVTSHTKNRKKNFWPIEYAKHVVLTTYDIMKEEGREFETFCEDKKEGIKKVLKDGSRVTIHRPHVPLYDEEWDRVVFDEAHRLSNNDTLTYKACKLLRGGSRTLLTGT